MDWKFNEITTKTFYLFKVYEFIGFEFSFGEKRQKSCQFFIRLNDSNCNDVEEKIFETINNFVNPFLID